MFGELTCIIFIICIGIWYTEKSVAGRMVKKIYTCELNEINSSGAMQKRGERIEGKK